MGTRNPGADAPALIKKDGGEMLIAIVLDRSLVEAQALVEPPDAFPSDHQDHARQTESPNYCANDQVGGKRRPEAQQKLRSVAF